MGNQIWVAGHGFPIEAKCIRWDETGGFNAHIAACVPKPKPTEPCREGGVVPWSVDAKNKSAHRFGNRPGLRGREHDLAAAQNAIRQFVLHLDGCPNADACFNTLHNERGLSCHFILDNDGTLYQTLDLVYMGYHAAGANARSIGIEMSNRGDAKKSPNYYKKQRRNVTTCSIHGHVYLAYEFTEAQYETMRALTKALTRALPNLPLEYPQELPGRQSWALFEPWKSYEGYLGHYHTTTRKWDPGPFDFKKFLESLRGKQSFPIATLEKEEPRVPEDAEERKAQVTRLYALNEEAALGGYFPVGPWGETAVWHGGVHLKAELRAPVYAPFAGRVVAARMKPGTSAVGSVNFVLLRHDMSVGTAGIRFWSLHYHLQYEGTKAEAAPKWLVSDKAKEAAAAPEGSKSPWLLDEPVEAGEVIGHIGQAGPDRKPQLHFEIFSNDEIGEAIERGFWQVRDGTSGGRYCDLAEIIEQIDVAPKDGKLSRRELESFHRSPGRTFTRRLAVISYSEWTPLPDWNEALRGVPDYRGQTQAQVDRMVGDQITPTLWLTPAVAAHAKIRRDGTVYHYHPITFLDFINEKLLEARIEAQASGLGAFDAKDAVTTKEAGVTDDVDDKSGDTFVTADELGVGNPSRPEPTFEELEAGFPD